MFFDLARLEPVWESSDEAIVQQFHGVMVSCSGGCDSTALLRVFLGFTKQKFNFPLAIFHMNFGLRGKESDKDQQFLEDLSTRFDLPLHVVSAAELGISPDGMSTQEWARKCRQKAVRPFMDSGWALALAHHQEDLAETVLLRLARGSSAGQLLGMTELQHGQWRPFLNERKSTLQKYLTNIGQNWREDATNATVDYARNRIRHVVLPELEALHHGATGRIVATARDAREHSEQLAADLLPLVQDDGTIQTNHFTALTPAASLQLIASLLRRHHGGSHQQLSRQLLQQVLQAAQSPLDSLWSRDLPGGGRVNILSGRLWVDNLP